MFMQPLTMDTGVYNHKRSAAVSISITQDDRANNINLVWQSMQKRLPFVTLLHCHHLEIPDLGSLNATVLGCVVEELWEPDAVDNPSCGTIPQSLLDNADIRNTLTLHQIYDYDKCPYRGNQDKPYLSPSISQIAQKSPHIFNICSKYFYFQKR